MWEGGMATILKVSKAFVCTLGLHDDRSIPPRIDVPSARSKLERYSLPTLWGINLKRRAVYPPNDVVVSPL